MLKIERSWWLALALVTITGCAGEDSSPPSSVLPSPGQAAIPARKADGRKPTASASAPAPAVKAETKSDVNKAEAPSLEGPKAEAPKPEASAVKLSAEEIAEIKKLPEADQAIALTQAVCPVSGEHLGAMDMPIKVTAEGRSFFICCKGCEKEIKSDPKGVIAKLDKK